MAITITLPDDVALSLMTQISGQVSRVLSSQTPPKNKRAQILDKLQTMSKGTIFTNVSLQNELSADCASITAALRTLRELNKVKMLHRGTWEKL